MSHATLQKMLAVFLVTYHATAALGATGSYLNAFNVGFSIAVGFMVGHFHGKTVGQSQENKK